MRKEAPDWLELLEEIADRADAIAMQLFRSRDLRVDVKADASPVTEADTAIEEAARSIVRRRCADVGVYGEEQGETAGSSDRRLIIDPIDGTRNFVRGIPIFATLLGVEVSGEVVAGVVSAPALGSRWRAARHKGAFNGSRPLRVSQIGRLHDAHVFHAGIGGRGEPGCPDGLMALAEHVERTRGFGDFYQHVLVAEGAGEAAVDSVVSPWDVAALLVLVEEAGGRATTLAGRRSIYGGSLVTSNGIVHDEVLQLLAAG